VTGVLKIRYALGSGETGEAEVASEGKWSFGRSDAAEPPSVATDDGRVSRNALTIRDSGPGPVVFRGQRGEGARVLVLDVNGEMRDVPEGTAVHLSEDARRVELWLVDELILRAQVEFEARGTVRERQEAADAEADAASTEQPD